MKAALVRVSLALALLLLMGGMVAMASASADQHWQPKQTKRYVCHPVNGHGELGNGWNLIAPAQASKHIIESEYPDGHYWKHVSHDGRHDVYADGQTCPSNTPTPTPTPTATTTPTPTATTTPTPTPTPTPTACPPGNLLNRIYGDRKANTLVGTICRDVIHAGNGNDVLKGLEADDVLLGGRGDDRLVGGPGRDALRGGLGRDVCVGDNNDFYVSCEVKR